MIRVAVLAFALFTLAAVLAAASGEAVEAQNPKLVGSVGPDFEIALRDAQGNRVTKLDPGTYDIEVRDLSDFHSFHLEGPGVDERTEVAFTGTVQWTVTFRDGNYEAHCDPHPDLATKFVVGNPTTTQPPTGNVVTARSRLVLTSGPAEVITLKTATGKVVKTMKLGTYNVTVRDRSRIHNAHVIAPGFNKKTTLTFVGTQRWKVPLKRTGRLRFLCDPHAITGMKGSARIVR
jgi:plastocyanin